LIGLFASAANPANVRIGIVGYSDKIVVSLPPTGMGTGDGRRALADATNALVPRGNTDIGLGLAHAKETLSWETDHEKAIILISDGETYIAQNKTGRGREASDADAEAVLSWAKENAVPIHAVMTEDYDGSADLVARLASESGGSLLGAGDTAGVLDLLRSTLSPAMKSPLTRIAEITGTGAQQDILLRVPHDQADLVNVVFRTSAPIGGLHAESDALTGDVGFFAGKRYGNISIQNPKNGEYRVKFTAPAGAMIEVFTLYGYSDMVCLILFGPGEEKSLAALLEAYNKGEAVLDGGFYESLSAEAIFENRLTGEKTIVPMIAEENGAYAEYETGPPPFDVSAEATVSGTVFSGAVSGADIVNENEPEKEFPLVPVLTGATITLLALVILLLIFRKKPVVPILRTEKYPYTGRLNGYVIRSADGAEYPPFAFVLSGYHSSEPISLREILLFALHDDLDATEATKILFSPGPSRALVFRHETSQTIMLGPLVTVAGESYIMDYGAKLYMMLQSGRVELEIHYKMAGAGETSTYAPNEIKG
jgi:hypothetical protein